MRVWVTFAAVLKLLLPAWLAVITALPAPTSVTVAVALFTVRVWVTFAAALKLLSPAWLAVITALPAPTRMTMLPEIVATPGSPLLKLTGKPDDAVALNVNAGSPNVFATKVPK